MKVNAKGRERRDGLGVTDLTITDLTDGKVLALHAILMQGAMTVLEKEVANFIIRGLKAGGHEHLKEVHIA